MKEQSFRRVLKHKKWVKEIDETASPVIKVAFCPVIIEYSRMSLHQKLHTNPTKRPHTKCSEVTLPIVEFVFCILLRT